MGFSRQEYWSGLPFPSPFLTQESNPGLPHYRQTLYHLSHQGSSKHQGNPTSLPSCIRELQPASGPAQGASKTSQIKPSQGPKLGLYVANDSSLVVLSLARFITPRGSLSKHRQQDLCFCCISQNTSQQRAGNQTFHKTSIYGQKRLVLCKTNKHPQGTPINHR